MRTIKTVFYPMKKLLVILLALSFFSCTKELGLSRGEKGYISVNGEKVTSISKGYEADMSGIGFGKGNWYLFETSQTKGNINYDDAVVMISAATDPETGKLYPSSIFIERIPGHDGIFIDGPKRADDGSYSYREYKYVAEGQAPSYVDHTITVDRFSTNAACTNLHADITIVSDITVRLVFSGSTPNDGMTYMMD